MNGATCVDGVNNFTCSCPPGYSGRHCEINIDDCAPQPCLNGGGCVDGVNLYICNCTNTGFTGDNCEQDIDECAVNPCINNATCLNLVNDYNCTCWDGFEGENCETDIPECALRPCQNNGTCYEKSNLGLYLEETYSYLSDNIRDHFTQEFSYANASGYICECLPGFQGNSFKTSCYAFFKHLYPLPIPTLMHNELVLFQIPSHLHSEPLWDDVNGFTAPFEPDPRIKVYKILFFVLVLCC